MRCLCLLCCLRCSVVICSRWWRRWCPSYCKRRQDAIWTKRDKSYCLEACLDVLLREYYRPDPRIGCKEVYLINIVDALAGKLLNLTSVRALKRREAAYIKRLEEMRRVRRHAESDNLVLSAVLVELWRSVAAVTV
jgi:hypothetical protein